MSLVKAIPSLRLIKTVEAISSLYEWIRTGQPIVLVSTNQREREITLIIKSLEPKRSSGQNGISPFSIKKNILGFRGALISFLKKRHFPRNSQTLKRKRLKRLVEYLRVNACFDCHMFGFQKGRGPEGAIFEFLKRVSSAVDRLQFAADAFCELSKAFDCVDFAVLTAKLM